jgi:hypothetical protein
MQTPEEKRKAIVVSDEKFEELQEELGDLRDAVEKMPHPDCEPFEQPLAQCQKEFTQLCGVFAALKQGSSWQKASTSPLADRNQASES